jgi:hypothetical protein
LDRRLHLLAPDLRVRAVGDRGRRYRSSHWSKCSGITIPRLLIHAGRSGSTHFEIPGRA